MNRERIDLKRWVMAAIGAFGVIFVGDYVIHNLWLGGFYRAHASWWRAPQEMQALMGVLILSELTLAALLALVYAKGYESGRGAAGQGLRFGFLMGVLLYVPGVLMKHFVYPYPALLLLNWMLGGLIEITVAGTVIGFLYKPEK